MGRGLTLVAYNKNKCRGKIGKSLELDVTKISTKLAKKINKKSL